MNDTLYYVVRFFRRSLRATALSLFSLLLFIGLARVLELLEERRAVFLLHGLWQ